MKTNIKGLVRTLDLRHAQGMMPLFEAVSNAMDAVADKGAGPNSGRIDIHLIRNADLAAQGSDGLQPIAGVRIIDDGVGFDDNHLDSFRVRRSRCFPSWCCSCRGLRDTRLDLPIGPVGSDGESVTVPAMPCTRRFRRADAPKAAKRAFTLSEASAFDSSTSRRTRVRPRSVHCGGNVPIV